MYLFSSIPNKFLDQTFFVCPSLFGKRSSRWITVNSNPFWRKASKSTCYGIYCSRTWGVCVPVFHKWYKRLWFYWNMHNQIWGRSNKTRQHFTQLSLMYLIPGIIGSTSLVLFKEYWINYHQIFRSSKWGNG